LLAKAVSRWLSCSFLFFFLLLNPLKARLRWIRRLVEDHRCRTRTTSNRSPICPRPSHPSSSADPSPSPSPSSTLLCLPVLLHKTNPFSTVLPRWPQTTGTNRSLRSRSGLPRPPFIPLQLRPPSAPLPPKQPSSIHPLTSLNRKPSVLNDPSPSPVSAGLPSPLFLLPLTRRSMEGKPPRKASRVRRGIE
jgi:hypothetical protein